MLRTVSGEWTRSSWGLAALLGLLVSALVLWNPAGAVVVTLAGSGVLAVLGRRRGLPGLALGFLGACLLGYALLGRGFAYLGAPPLYIGEVALFLGLLVLALDGRVRSLAASPVVYALLVFLLIGAAATLPYLGRYGIDALRDAVLWAYGLFALVVAALLLRVGGVLEAARQYARFVPLLLLWLPPALLLYELAPFPLPQLPGANAALLDLKGGDVAVHLAGVAALLLLGLPRLLDRETPIRWLGGRSLRLTRLDWLWWTLWFAAAAIPVFRVRAGLLAIAAAVLVVLLFRPGTRWWKPLVLFAFILTCFLTFNVSIKLGESRNTISAQSLLLNVQSITGNTGEGYRDGSRRWRLEWWQSIVNYTVHGPYFWTGKGYGINLADADGFQVNEDSSLRSPHNGHLNILARSGVPGLTAWVLLQGLFALSLLRAYRRAAALGEELWARLNLWVLAYWAAFMINAAFDVFLEGPQGGIWFWSLLGFGIALLEVQRRRFAGRAARPEGAR